MVNEPSTATPSTGVQHNRHAGNAAGRRRASRDGFTLVEVMVSILIVSMLATAGFSSMSFIRRSMLDSLYTAEAYRIAQAEIESLQSGPFAEFVASPEETVESSITTTYRRSQIQRFVHPVLGADDQLTFTRDVEVVPAGPAPSAFVQLRVNIHWSCLGRDRNIFLTTCRAP